MNTETNYNTLKDNKLIGGAGRGFFLTELPDTKFTQKNFVEKYNSDEQFRSVFDNQVDILYKSFVPEVISFTNEEEIEIETLDLEETVSIDLVECIDQVNNIWIGSDKKYYSADTMQEVEVEFE